MYHPVLTSNNQSLKNKKSLIFSVHYLCLFDFANNEFCKTNINCLNCFNKCYLKRKFQGGRLCNWQFLSDE